MRSHISPDLRSRTLLLQVMCVGYFLVLLDVTIVNVALPRIGAGLHADLDGLQWVVDGYAVPLAGLLLVSGTLGDRAGHRRGVLAGLVTFGVASLACCLAPSTAGLIVARVGQGVGAALLLPATLAVVSTAFPGRAEQARAIGVWAGVGSVALPAGPLLGGVLVQGLGWRAVFGVNVPIVALAYPAAARLIRSGRPRTPRRADPSGALFATLTLVGTTLAVIEAGSRGHGAIGLGAAAAAVVSLVAFVAVERAVAEPMLPLPLFRSARFTAANGIAAAMNLGTLGLLFVLTQYLQTLQRRPPFSAGAALLPLLLPLVVLAPYSGRLAARRGPRPAMVAGLLLAAAGVAWLAVLPAQARYPELFPPLLAWGVGLGLLTPAVVAAAVGAVPADRAGLASGVNNACRQAGGALGIAALGAVAGPVGSVGRFISGSHLGALAVGALWFGCAVVAGLVFG